MTDVETRLRDALSVRASSVPHDPYAYGAIARRRANRRFTRLAAPIAAVAATAALVGAATVTVRFPERAGPAGGGPARLGVLLENGRALVVERANPRGPVLAQSPPEYGEVDDLSTADGETFYAAAGRKGTCASVLFTMTADGRSTKLLDVAGAVTGLAVSPDGQRLAYAVAVRRGTPDAIPGCGTIVDVHVRDLATRTEKVWRGYLGVTPAQHLTWSADGRYLAHDGVFDVSRIDTTAPATRRPKAFLDNFRNPYGGGLCFPRAPGYLPTGELVVLVDCENAGTDDPTTSRAVVVDPVTGRLGRVVFRLPNKLESHWLAFDRTGENALVGAGKSTFRDVNTRYNVVYWWQPGKQPRRVSDASKSWERVVW
ncbi:MAG TPA: hypothetical protein VNA20_17105 [Frankiaceae bacterium]|nr:hypothetical protein [Frankiaceae bacterium]